MLKPHFDPLIHEPNRLQICAYLDSISEVEFQALREYLDLSESALSKHIKALESADYIKAVKRGVGRKRTWIAFSDSGRRAFKDHVQALQRMIGVP